MLIIATPAFADVTGPARIVDGDTVHIGKTKIRFHGINAPESKQKCTADGKVWPCGQEATQALVEAISDHPVTCEGDKRDRYKRLLAVCA
jgi:endonuclease YncB( thermonuclease family)